MDSQIKSIQSSNVNTGGILNTIKNCFVYIICCKCYKKKQEMEVKNFENIAVNTIKSDNSGSIGDQGMNAHRMSTLNINRLNNINYENPVLTGQNVIHVSRFQNRNLNPNPLQSINK